MANELEAVLAITGRSRIDEAKLAEICKRLCDNLETVRNERDAVLGVLRDVELMARVNAPVCDGSPIHKAVLDAIKKYGGGKTHGK